MTVLRCEWCGDERSPRRQATCRDACRAARWRWLNCITGKAGAAPEPPPWAESPLHGRMGEAARSNAAQLILRPRAGHQARSGAQVSFRKAVAVLADAINRMDGGMEAPAVYEEEATNRMAAALSLKQRTRLEGRDQ